MIDIKEASQIAADYISALYPNSRSILLEEVERVDDMQLWILTISFMMDETNVFGIYANQQRKYKIFRIDGEKGEVISMKIREVR